VFEVVVAFFWPRLLRENIGGLDETVRVEGQEGRKKKHLVCIQPTIIYDEVSSVEMYR
jgi:hypothetical protein